MTDQQPKALRLAAENEAGAHGYPASTIGHQLHMDTAAELRRLHDLLGKANAMARIRATRIEELESQLESIGAGGVGPLMQHQVDHQSNTSSNNNLPIKSGHLSTRSSTAPAGWRLVPVEPTAAMLNAWCQTESAASAHIHPSDVMRAGYRAMLAAAPQPPVIKDYLTTEQAESAYQRGYLDGMVKGREDRAVERAHGIGGEA